MKVKTLIGLMLLIFSSGVYAQDDECKRYKAIAGNAYQAKNYVKVTWAYNIAQRECGELDMKFYNPYIYSVKKAMKNASDEATKAAYLDTLITVYEKAQESHGLQKDWQAYLGYYYMKQGKPGFMKKGDDAYKIGLHHEGPKANAGMIKQYYANLYNLWVQEKDEKKKLEYKERLINEYFKFSEYLNDNDKGAETIDFLTTYLNKAVTDCASVLPSINKMINSLPSDKDSKLSSINNFMELLEDKKCTDSKEYAMLVDTIIEIDPSVGAIVAKAKLLSAQGNTSEAIKTYKEALEMEEDGDKKSDIELEIARSYYNARNYKSAYNAGKNVSGKNSKKGYEISAKSVNAMMNDCGVSTFDRKANNYYAVELAEKSGNSSLIKAYKSQCPTSSDVFNQSMEEGETIKLECWNKTVTIKIYE